MAGVESAGYQQVWTGERLGCSESSFRIFTRKAEQFFSKTLLTSPSVCKLIPALDLGVDGFALMPDLGGGGQDYLHFSPFGGRPQRLQAEPKDPPRNSGVARGAGC